MNLAGDLRLSLRLLLRDWKSGELLVLAAALVIAVTALTAVGFLTNRIGQAVELRASASLAADLRPARPRVPGRRSAPVFLGTPGRSLPGIGAGTVHRQRAHGVHAQRSVQR